MEPLGVNHVAIKALDIPRTVEFYVDVLGLTETHRNVDENGLRSVWLRCGAVILMIERSEVAGDSKLRASTTQRSISGFHDDPPGLHLLALTISPEHRSAWVERIRTHGHQVLHQTSFTIYVQDPEGNRIGLSTWPNPARPE